MALNSRLSNLIKAKKPGDMCRPGFFTGTMRWRGARRWWAGGRETPALHQYR
jgi:hypothetical protein